MAQLFTLRSDEVTARITDFGGNLVSVETPDRRGRHDHVLLGFEDVAGYVDNHGSFGALLGRNANRIAGGHIVVDGQSYTLAKNEPNSTLHGGPLGFGKLFWSVIDADTNRLRLTLDSEDGDQGFPGEVHAAATYELTGDTLRLLFEASTTRPTPLTLSAHPYFNLDGPEARDCLDHEVQIFAAHFLPTDAAQIPTGELYPVAGTPFDFLQPRRIGERIRTDHSQLRIGHGYDHYFVLPDDTFGTLRLAARVEAAHSGRVLEILTTQRGLQFYSGNNLNGSANGRGGLYRQSAGFAFEPQGFPDAPNQPNFPSTILRPGETYREEIAYRFRVR
ncbi:MAG TPA: aldose epimerase family protein [Beijerinckiaceae bacterium]|jgi:aldose 1-epimerase|nr:aldose epimerase family protein [Beijerinckiaceae bacterium]